MKSKTIIILLCLITQVFQINGLTQLKNSLASSDSPLLMKVLELVDAATSNEHLLQVTLKLLQSLCACMRESLRAKEDYFNISKHSLEANKFSGSEGKVFDLYINIYNHSCFHLRQELTNRTHKFLFDEESALLNHTNCGKDEKNETYNKGGDSKKPPDVKHSISSRLEQVLYKALIETKDLHDYRLRKYNLFGKNTPQVKSALQHILIVILTLHPNEQEVTSRKNNIDAKDLIITLHTKSPIDVDIIDSKHDQNLKEENKSIKAENLSDCNLQSLYKFLIENDRMNLTKVFKFIRKRDTLKIYIEVNVGQKNTDFMNICCENGNTMPLCNKEFINVSQSNFFDENYMNTITKIKSLVNQYENQINDTHHNLTAIKVQDENKEENIVIETTTKQNVSYADGIDHKENYIHKSVTSSNEPSKLGEVTQAIILLNDYVTKQSTKKILQTDKTVSERSQTDIVYKDEEQREITTTYYPINIDNIDTTLETNVQEKKHKSESINSLHFDENNKVDKNVPENEKKTTMDLKNDYTRTDKETNASFGVTLSMFQEKHELPQAATSRTDMDVFHNNNLALNFSSTTNSRSTAIPTLTNNEKFTSPTLTTIKTLKPGLGITRNVKNDFESYLFGKHKTKVSGIRSTTTTFITRNPKKTPHYPLHFQKVSSTNNTALLSDSQDKEIHTERLTTDDSAIQNILYIQGKKANKTSKYKTTAPIKPLIKQKSIFKNALQCEKQMLFKTQSMSNKTVPVNFKNVIRICGESKPKNQTIKATAPEKGKTIVGNALSNEMTTKKYAKWTKKLNEFGQSLIFHVPKTKVNITSTSESPETKNLLETTNSTVQETTITTKYQNNATNTSPKSLTALSTLDFALMHNQSFSDDMEGFNTIDREIKVKSISTVVSHVSIEEPDVQIMQKLRANVTNNYITKMSSTEATFSQPTLSDSDKYSEIVDDFTSEAKSSSNYTNAGIDNSSYMTTGIYVNTEETSTILLGNITTNDITMKSANANSSEITTDQTETKNKPIKTTASEKAKATFGNALPNEMATKNSTENVNDVGQKLIFKSSNVSKMNVNIISTSESPETKNLSEKTNFTIQETTMTAEYQNITINSTTKSFTTPYIFGLSMHNQSIDDDMESFNNINRVTKIGAMNVIVSHVTIEKPNLPTVQKIRTNFANNYTSTETTFSQPAQDLRQTDNDTNIATFHDFMSEAQSSSNNANSVMETNIYATTSLSVNTEETTITVEGSVATTTILVRNISDNELTVNSTDAVLSEMTTDRTAPKNKTIKMTAPEKGETGFSNAPPNEITTKKYTKWTEILSKFEQNLSFHSSKVTKTNPNITSTSESPETKNILETTNNTAQETIMTEKYQNIATNSTLKSLITHSSLDLSNLHMQSFRDDMKGFNTIDRETKVESISTVGSHVTIEKPDVHIVQKLGTNVTNNYVSEISSTEATFSLPTHSDTDKYPEIVDNYTSEAKSSINYTNFGIKTSSHMTTDIFVNTADTAVIVQDFVPTTILLGNITANHLTKKNTDAVSSEMTTDQIECKNKSIKITASEKGKDSFDNAPLSESTTKKWTENVNEFGQNFIFNYSEVTKTKNTINSTLESPEIEDISETTMTTKYQNIATNTTLKPMTTLDLSKLHTQSSDDDTEILNTIDNVSKVEPISIIIPHVVIEEPNVYPVQKPRMKATKNDVSFTETTFSQPTMVVSKADSDENSEILDGFIDVVKSSSNYSNTATETNSYTTTGLFVNTDENTIITKDSVPTILQGNIFDSELTIKGIDAVSSEMTTDEMVPKNKTINTRDDLIDLAKLGSNYTIAATKTNSYMTTGLSMNNEKNTIIIEDSVSVSTISFENITDNVLTMKNTDPVLSEMTTGLNKKEFKNDMTFGNITFVNNFANTESILKSKDVQTYSPNPPQNKYTFDERNYQSTPLFFTEVSTEPNTETALEAYTIPTTTYNKHTVTINVPEFTTSSEDLKNTESFGNSIFESGDKVTVYNTTDITIVDNEYGFTNYIELPELKVQHSEKSSTILLTESLVTKTNDNLISNTTNLNDNFDFGITPVFEETTKLPNKILLSKIPEITNLTSKTTFIYQEPETLAFDDIFKTSSEMERNTQLDKDILELTDTSPAEFISLTQHLSLNVNTNTESVPKVVNKVSNKLASHNTNLTTEFPSLTATEITTSELSEINCEHVTIKANTLADDIWAIDNTFTHEELITTPESVTKQPPNNITYYTFTEPLFSPNYFTTELRDTVVKDVTTSKILLDENQTENNLIKPTSTMAIGPSLESIIHTTIKTKDVEKNTEAITKKKYHVNVFTDASTTIKLMPSSTLVENTTRNTSRYDKIDYLENYGTTFMQLKNNNKSSTDNSKLKDENTATNSIYKDNYSYENIQELDSKATPIIFTTEMISTFKTLNGKNFSSLQILTYQDFEKDLITTISEPETIEFKNNTVVETTKTSTFLTTESVSPVFIVSTPVTLISMDIKQNTTNKQLAISDKSTKQILSNPNMETTQYAFIEAFQTNQSVIRPNATFTSSIFRANEVTKTIDSRELNVTLKSKYSTLTKIPKSISKFIKANKNYTKKAKTIGDKNSKSKIKLKKPIAFELNIRVGVEANKDGIKFSILDEKETAMYHKSESRIPTSTCIHSNCSDDYIKEALLKSHTNFVNETEKNTTISLKDKDIFLKNMTLNRRSNLNNSEDLSRIAEILDKLSLKPPTIKSKLIQRTNTRKSFVRNTTIKEEIQTLQRNTTSSNMSTLTSYKNVTKIKHKSKIPGALTEQLAINNIKDIYKEHFDKIKESLNYTKNGSTSATDVLKNFYEAIISFSVTKNITNSNINMPGVNNTLHKFENQEIQKDDLATLFRAKNDSAISKPKSNKNAISKNSKQINKKLDNVLKKLLRGKKLSKNQLRKLKRKLLKNLTNKINITGVHRYHDTVKKKNYGYMTANSVILNTTNNFTTTEANNITSMQNKEAFTASSVIIKNPKKKINTTQSNENLGKGNNTKKPVKEILNITSADILHSTRRVFGILNNNSSVSLETRRSSFEFKPEIALQNTSTEANFGFDKNVATVTSSEIAPLITGKRFPEILQVLSEIDQDLLKLENESNNNTSENSSPIVLNASHVLMKKDVTKGIQSIFGSVNDLIEELNEVSAQENYTITSSYGDLNSTEKIKNTRKSNYNMSTIVSDTGNTVAITNTKSKNSATKNEISDLIMTKANQTTTVFYAGDTTHLLKTDYENATSNKFTRDNEVLKYTIPMTTIKSITFNTQHPIEDYFIKTTDEEGINQHNFISTLDTKEYEEKSTKIPDFAEIQPPFAQINEIPIINPTNYNITSITKNIKEQHWFINTSHAVAKNIENLDKKKTQPLQSLQNNREKIDRKYLISEETFLNDISTLKLPTKSSVTTFPLQLPEVLSKPLNRSLTITTHISVYDNFDNRESFMETTKPSQNDLTIDPTFLRLDQHTYPTDIEENKPNSYVNNNKDVLKNENYQLLVNKLMNNGTENIKISSEKILNVTQNILPVTDNQFGKVSPDASAHANNTKSTQLLEANNTQLFYAVDKSVNVNKSNVYVPLLSIIHNNSKIIQDKTSRNNIKNNLFLKIHDGQKNISVIHTPNLTHVKVTKLNLVNRTTTNFKPEVQKLLLVLGNKEKSGKDRIYQNNTVGKNYHSNFKSLFPNIESGNFKGKKSIDIYSTHLSMPYNAHTTATAVTKSIKYNTYRPISKEELELLKLIRDPIFQTAIQKQDIKPYPQVSAVNNSSAAILSGSNNLQSKGEAKLKASNLLEADQIIQAYERKIQNKDHGDNGLHLETKRNLNKPIEMFENLHSSEINRISHPILEININSPQIRVDGDSPPMIEINGNPLPVEINQNSALMENNRNPVPLEMHRNSVQMEMNRNSAPMNINRNTDPLKMNRNQAPLEMNKNSAPLDINRNSVQMENRNTAMMNLNRNPALIEMYEKSIPLEINSNSVPLKINRNPAPLEMNRNLVPLELNRNPTPLVINRNSAPLEIIRNSVPMEIKRNPLPLEINGNLVKMEINRNIVMMNMNRNLALMGPNKNPIPMEINRNSAPIQINRNPTPLEMNRNSTPMEMNRNAASMKMNKNSIPMEINRNSDPMEINRNPAPLEINRNSTPMEMNRNSASMKMNRNSDPLEMNINLTPLEINRNSAPLEMSQNSAPLEMNKNLALMEMNRNSAPVEINRNPVPLEMNGNSVKMEINRNTAMMNMNRNPALVQPNKNSIPVEINRNPAVMELNRNSDPLEMNKNSAPLEINKNSAPQEIIRNSTPLKINTKADPREMNGNSVNMEINRNTAMMNMNRNPDLTEPNKNSIPLEINRNPAPLEFIRNTAVMEANKNSMSLEMNRNSAPQEISQNPAPLEMNRNLAPIEMNRNSAPVEMNKNSVPLEMNRNSAPLEMNRNLAPLEKNRNSDLMGLKKDLAQIIMNRNSVLMDNNNRNAVSTGLNRNAVPIEIKRNSVSIDFSRNPVPIETYRNSVPTDTNINSVPIEINRNPLAMDSNRNPLPMKSNRNLVLMDTNKKIVPMQTNTNSMLQDINKKLVPMNTNKNLEMMNINTNSVPLEVTKSLVSIEFNTKSIPMNIHENSNPQKNTRNIILEETNRNLVQMETNRDLFRTVGIDRSIPTMLNFNRNYSSTVNLPSVINNNRNILLDNNNVPSMNNKPLISTLMFDNNGKVRETINDNSNVSQIIYEKQNPPSINNINKKISSMATKNMNALSVIDPNNKKSSITINRSNGPAIHNNNKNSRSMETNKKLLPTKTFNMIKTSIMPVLITTGIKKTEPVAVAKKKILPMKEIKRKPLLTFENNKKPLSMAGKNRKAHGPLQINSKTHSKVFTKNYKKIGPQKETFFESFERRNPYAVKIKEPKANKKVKTEMKQIQIGTRRKAVMTMNTQDFLSQHRTPRSYLQKNTKPYLMFLKPEPSIKKTILRPKFNKSIYKTKRLEHRLKPKPVFIKKDILQKDLISHRQLMGTVKKKERMNNVLEMPIWQSTVKPMFFKDNEDAINNMFTDYMRITKRPVFNDMARVPNYFGDNYNPSPSYRKSNIEQSTTAATRKPKHGRTIFFLSPTGAYGDYN